MARPTVNGANRDLSSDVCLDVQADRFRKRSASRCSDHSDSVTTTNTGRREYICYRLPEIDTGLYEADRMCYSRMDCP